MEGGFLHRSARCAPEMIVKPGALKLGALAVSEPQGGSGVVNLRTRGRWDGEQWVLDRHKMWIGLTAWQPISELRHRSVSDDPWSSKVMRR